MRILIATIKVPFIRGGAELHAENLQSALEAHGHDVDTVAVPFRWSPPEQILDGMLACRMLDMTETARGPVDLMIALRFPAYYIRHPNKVVWLLHQYRSAYELWDHPQVDLGFWPNGQLVRDTIREADRSLLPEARKIFANSKTVAGRLQKYCGIASVPLYHPPPLHDRLHHAEATDYIFFPSRLNPLKRQSLVLEALGRTRSGVRIASAGVPESVEYMDLLQREAHRLGVQDKILWLGRIPDEELVERYARCVAVIYPPLDEDYGYVSLEAMLAAKPLITCTDSGGPNEFVLPGETGLVVPPDAAEIASALDLLWEDRTRAVKMGHAGRARYESLNLSWDSVVDALTATPASAG
jgi:glycosyltransferase involved in cell wall biosynthesis